MGLQLGVWSRVVHNNQYITESVSCDHTAVALQRQHGTTKSFKGMWEDSLTGPFPILLVPNVTFWANMTKQSIEWMILQQLHYMFNINCLSSFLGVDDLLLYCGGDLSPLIGVTLSPLYHINQQYVKFNSFFSSFSDPFFLTN